MKQTPEEFQAHLDALGTPEERKAAIDARNLAMKAEVPKDPDPNTFHAPPGENEHPVYGVQYDLRTLEMALSKVAAFHNSDVQKALAALKDRVHGIIDALPGVVQPSKTKLL